MSVIVPDGFGRAAIHFSLDGLVEDMVITFGITDDTGLSPNSVASAIRVNWTTAFALGELLDTWNVGPYDVSLNRGGAFFDGTDGTVQAGTVAGDGPPLAVCILARKSTDEGGRANRGRCYLPAGYIDEGSVSDAGVIDSTPHAQLTASWAAFIASMIGSNLDMVILHSEIGLTPTPVTGSSVDNVVATQRRRQRR